MSQNTEAAPTAQESRPHSHYFKDVSQLQQIDVYRVLELFGVTDPCLQHAAKKILCAGQRGLKELTKDVGEARDSLVRRLEMWAEEFPPVESAPLPKQVPNMYEHFLPHQLDVVRELEDLEARANEKYQQFQRAVSDTTFARNGATKVDCDTLREQVNLMHGMQRVLQRRIDHWLAQIEASKKAGKL